MKYEHKEEIHYKLFLENFEKGAKVLQRGSECKGIIYIVSGQVDLIIDRDGKEYILDSLGPGCTVGNYSIFN